MPNQPPLSHVFVRVSGYGLSVLPHAPYSVLISDPFSLDVSYFSPDGERFARLIADGAGGYSSKIDQNTNSLYDVLEINASNWKSEWRIETSGFTCLFPNGYELVHTNFPQEATIVDLRGENGEAIYIQVTQTVPDLRKMVAPGQKVLRVDPGAGIIDLEYRHEGQKWCQRHQVHAEASLVVSLQAPMQLAQATCMVAHEVFQSLQPCNMS